MKLNVACGSNVFPLPWLNTDHVDLEDGTHPEEPKRGYLWHMRRVAERGDDVSTWPEEQRRLVEYIAAGRIRFFQWDLRKGFPMYADGSVEAAYIGQLWEHLHPIREAPKLAAECFRLLKPGGAVRIVTPDIRKIVQAYVDNKMGRFVSEQPAFYERASEEARLSFLLFGASGDGCTQEHYDGHFHIWSDDDLMQLLRAAGFSSVCSSERKSAVFADCTDKGLSHSFAVEAVK